MRQRNPSLLFAICAWSLLILRFGYVYGTGDQVELLPYVLFLHNPTLYPHDFFIQGLSATVPNERTVMAQILLPFINHLELACFVLHAFSTIILVLGLEKIALRYIANRYIAWFAVLVTLIPLNDFNLGNVEIYYVCLQASVLTSAILVWALNLFLDKRFLWCYLLLAAATFIQLLEGLDMAIVLSFMLIWAFFEKQVSLKILVASLGLYAAFAGTYLAAVLIAKQPAISQGDKHLFDILFVFRHSHHFIFSNFPVLKTVTFFSLSAIGAVYFFRKRDILFRFYLIGFVLIAVYAIGTDLLHNIFIAGFQMYKITPWMKFIGLVAGLAWLANGQIKEHWLNCIKNWQWPLLLGTSFLCWIVIIGYNHSLPYNVPFEIFSLKQHDEAIQLCEVIEQKLPVDAVFIQPFDNTAFKFYARRSSFIEFKANVRDERFINEWYNRVNLIYGISLTDDEKGFELENKANAHYYTNDVALINEWVKAGIDYMLVKADYVPPSGTLILKNTKYAVYKLG